MQSLGFSTQPINRCARSSLASLAQPLGLPVSVARPWLSSTHSAASWPVLSSTAPGSLCPRRSLAARAVLPAAGSASSPGKAALRLEPSPTFCQELASSRLRLQIRSQPRWSPHRLRHGPSAFCLGAQPRLPLRFLSSSSWSPFLLSMKLPRRHSRCTSATASAVAAAAGIHRCTDLLRPTHGDCTGIITCGDPGPAWPVAPCA